MNLKLISAIRKVIPFHLYLIKKGVLIDFYRLLMANPAREKDQIVILNHGPNLLNKTEEGSPPHQIALETISDVYMRQHKFSEAAAGFESALSLFLKNTKDITSQTKTLSYLTLSLASCYYNLGERGKVSQLIAEAVTHGVPPENFEGLINTQQLKNIIEQSVAGYPPQGVGSPEP